jgi:hypothetical protein
MWFYRLGKRVRSVSLEATRSENGTKVIQILEFRWALRNSQKQDARSRLFGKIDAWDEYGQSGWGADSKETIFESVADFTGHKLAVVNTVRALKCYTTTYWLERLEEKLYIYDYENPVLNLTRKQICSAPRVLRKNRESGEPSSNIK